VTLAVQGQTIVAMMLSGIGLGVIFDTCRVIADAIKLNRLWIALVDLFYWLGATLVVFQILSANNDGEVRAYVFIGLLCGTVFYYVFLSRSIVKLVQLCIRLVKAITNVLVRSAMILIIRPIVMLYKLLLTVVLATTMVVVHIIMRLLRVVTAILWWLFRPLIRYVSKLLRPYMNKWLPLLRIRRLWAKLCKREPKD
jgi:spore cortex biosynthesis protein YabQ